MRRTRGEVQIKDLIEGAKAWLPRSLPSRNGAESRPSAVSACSEDELVAKVREVLARHEVKWG